MCEKKNRLSNELAKIDPLYRAMLNDVIIGDREWPKAKERSFSQATGERGQSNFQAVPYDTSK